MTISKTGGNLEIDFRGYRSGTAYARQTYPLGFHVSDGTIYWYAIGN